MKTVKFLFALLLGITFTLLNTDISAMESLFANPDWIATAVIASPVIAMNNYAGTHEGKLFRELTNGMEVWDDVEVHSMVKSTENLTKLSISKGGRPYSGRERVKGDAITLSGQTLSVDIYQRDFGIEIKKFHATWQEAQLKKTEGSSSDQKTVPFAAYIMDAVIEMLGSELNDVVAYHGLGVAAFPLYEVGTAYALNDTVHQLNSDGEVDYYECIQAGTGNDPNTATLFWTDANAKAISKGYGSHVAQGVADGKLVPIVTGVIDADTAYEAQTAMFRSHTDKYKSLGVKHYVSYDQFYLLLDSIEKSVGKYTEKDGVWVNGRGLYLPKTNNKCMVLPCSWMSGTNRIMSTPTGGLLAGTDRTNDNNNIKTRDASNYHTVSSITGVIGFTPRDLSVMRVNDQL
jgi:hypothetical protein